MVDYLDKKTARYEACKLSMEELEALPVKSGLRTLAAGIGLVGKLLQDGKEVTISSAKKETLVKAIWDSLESERISSAVTADLSEEELADINQLADDADDLSDSDLGTVALKYFNYIKEYTDSLWQHGTWKATDGGLVSIANEFVMDLLSRRSKRTGQAMSSETVMAYKAVIKKNVFRMMSDILDTPHHAKYHEIFDLLFGAVKIVNGVKGYQRGLIDQGLKVFSNQKKQHSNERLTERKGNPSRVNVSRLYERVRILLSELKMTDKAHINQLWADVSVALMLATGRRLSEVMSTAVFEKIDERDDVVIFRGQLKTKGRVAEDYSYEIPLLASANDVIKALQWLGDNGKRADDNEVAHKRYSKPLSEKTKEWDVFIDYEYRRDDMKLTSHLCRQIYAQMFKNQGKGTSHHNISKILGHDENDNSTADRYDADIIVVG